MDSNECQKSKFLRAQQQSGSIASVTAHETYCGTVDTPWLIQGSIGQRINISLTDFNAQRRDIDFAPFESCHKYATIIERESSKHSVAVCGRRSRYQQVFVSDGHIVQIQIETRRVSHDYFIISYESTRVLQLTYFRIAIFCSFSVQLIDLLTNLSSLVLCLFK